MSMATDIIQPTPYADVNTLLHRVLSGAQAILGDHFIGMYVEGSLACDAFDAASDIDFVVVTRAEITGELFGALQALHDRIASSDSPWATELEGSYISQSALRRYDMANAVHPNIERGPGERLKLVDHDAGWNIHRYLLRERGITLAGPAPRTLVDAVAPDDLRRAMRASLPNWAVRLLDTPALVQHRGYQSYIVLTVCRVLYTLQHGTVVSKRVAADWAGQYLDQRWTPLIEQAWAGRQNPQQAASPEDVKATLELLRYAVEQSRRATC